MTQDQQEFEQLFQDCVVALIGYDPPNDGHDELIGLSAAVQLFGGTWQHDLTALDKVTVIVVGPLGISSHFLAQLRAVPVSERPPLVHPTWITDSVNRRRRFQWRPYKVPCPGLDDTVADPAHSVSGQRVEMGWYYTTRDIQAVAKPTFRGKTLYLHDDISLVLRQRLGGVVAADGGTVVLHETKLHDQLVGVDMLVFRHAQSALFVKAMDLGKPVASMYWLFDVIRTSDWVDPTASVLHFPFPPPPRKITYPAVQLCVTEFEGYERDYVKKMIELLGTKYSSTMSTETTHLVAARPKGTKFTAATGWPTVRIVNAEWLEDSLMHGVLQDDTLPQYTHFRDPTELPRPVVGATPIPQSAIDRVVRAAREHEARVQERRQRALESLLDAQGHLAGEPVEERRAKGKVQASLRNQWQEFRKLGKAEREAVVKTWELEDADFLMSDGEDGKDKAAPAPAGANDAPPPVPAVADAAVRDAGMDVDPAPVPHDSIAARSAPPVLGPPRSAEVKVSVKALKPATATPPVEPATVQQKEEGSAVAVGPALRDAMDVDNKLPVQETTPAARPSLPSKRSAPVCIPTDDTPMSVSHDDMEVLEDKPPLPDTAAPASRCSTLSAQASVMANETAVATPPSKPPRRPKTAQDPLMMTLVPASAVAAHDDPMKPTLPAAPEPKSEPHLVPEPTSQPHSTAALANGTPQPAVSAPGLAPAPRKPVEVHLAAPALAPPQVLKPKPRATRSHKSATTTASAVATAPPPTTADPPAAFPGATAVVPASTAAEPAPTPTPAAPKRRLRKSAGAAAADTPATGTSGAPPPEPRPRRSASMVSTTSLSPAASSGPPNIAFTQVRPTVREQRVLERLGATVNPRSIDPPCTHLVTKDVTRTEKFLYAVLTARYIVEKGWIEKCVEVGHLVDEEPYLLTVLTPSGKSVRDVMALCRTHPPLRGYCVAVHPNVAAPPAVMSNDTFRRLALAAGAEEVLNYSRVPRYSTATRGPLLVFAAEMAPDLVGLQSKPDVTLLLINALGQTILTADLASTMADAQFQLPRQQG
ncbi:hypothetical protein GGF31_005976 [Allomyces arbusculus]|nr:hypothetical protein GGF31_005976 [Allomyces arbusculus]